LRTCLIIGINGQDGHYLSKRAFLDGYNVIGVGRQAKPAKRSAKFLEDYKQLDMSKLADVNKLILFIKNQNIEDIYYLAAVHGTRSERQLANKLDAYTVNYEAPRFIFESCTSVRKFIYFGSWLIYGDKLDKRISEQTQHSPQCYYSESKSNFSKYVTSLPIIQRSKIACLNFFNHESEIREEKYLSKRISNAIKNSTPQEAVRFAGKLDFLIDWGSAEDFMEHVFYYRDTIYGNVNIASGITQNTMNEMLSAMYELKLINKELLNDLCVPVEKSVGCDIKLLKSFAPEFKSRTLRSLLVCDSC